MFLKRPLLVATQLAGGFLFIKNKFFLSAFFSIFFVR